MNTNNIIKHSLKAVMLFGLLVSLLTSCGDSNVTLVKDGTMNSYPQGTIGNVLDANFDSTDWSSEEKGGKTFVNFSGEISEGLRAKALAKDYPKGVETHKNIRESIVRSNMSQKFMEELKILQANRPQVEGISQTKKLEAELNILRSKLKEVSEKLYFVRTNELPQSLNGNNPKYEAQKAVYDKKLKPMELEVQRMKEKSSELNQKLYDLRRAMQKEGQNLGKEFRLAQEVLVKNLFAEYLETGFYKEGEIISLKWVVHPNDESFELIEFSSDTVATSSSIFRVAFSD
ncbi:hypothetical protein LNTAR_16408 [Lentisphaera araneosa HTCC2155]|uniref:Lipoprotein n=1 Tax=Lentisphaera araneosa HTCC2155 TaxID=313628 RepID=A6DQ96_9BACT|nr:hypothetical protein [Lentisphaera araneosa]EDM26147.1 hypothetical protein LNTAR_16408 [Lentisphaera araneosa HTCC2155]